jgi:hypothetical protein
VKEEEVDDRSEEEEEDEDSDNPEEEEEKEPIEISEEEEQFETVPVKKGPSFRNKAAPISKANLKANEMKPKKLKRGHEESEAEPAQLKRQKVDDIIKDSENFEDLGEEDLF